MTIARRGPGMLGSTRSQGLEIETVENPISTTGSEGQISAAQRSPARPDNRKEHEGTRAEPWHSRASAGGSVSRKSLPREAPSAVAACPLYGISPLALSQRFRLPEQVCSVWKADLRRSPKDAAAVALLVQGDLGAFSSEWAGWTVADGNLWTPDGVRISPGEVAAVPARQAQLAEFERAQRWMIESALQDQRRSRAIAEAEDLAKRLIEALRQR